MSRPHLLGYFHNNNNNNCIFIAQDPLKCSDAQNNISLHIGQHLEENY